MPTAFPLGDGTHVPKTPLGLTHSAAVGQVRKAQSVSEAHRPIPLEVSADPGKFKQFSGQENPGHELSVAPIVAVLISK